MEWVRLLGSSTTCQRFSKRRPSLSSYCVCCCNTTAQDSHSAKTARRWCFLGCALIQMSRWAFQGSCDVDTKCFHPLPPASTPCHGCAETLACTTTKWRLDHSIISRWISIRRQSSVAKTGVYSNAVFLTCPFRTRKTIAIRSFYILTLELCIFRC